MNKMRFVLTAIIGGAIICVMLIMVIPTISIVPIQGRFIVPIDERAGPTPASRVSETQVVIPTLTVPASSTDS